MIPQYTRINNRKNFLLPEIPDYYPGTTKYINWWADQKKKCIEGLWVNDEGEFRWTPPNLYFYVNFGTILHNANPKRPNDPKIEVRPYLRDIEWEFFYNLMLCRGFSGFEEDEEYSCHISFVDPEVPIDSYCYKADGTLKTYMDPFKLIRMTRDKPMGRAVFNNPMKDLFILASRGLGKSYLVGVGVILHAFLFDGATVYNRGATPNTIELIVGAAISTKSGDLLDKTLFALNRLPGERVINGQYFPAPFSKIVTGSVSKPNSVLRNSYEEKHKGGWKKAGSNSSIKHVAWTTENPNAAVGTRPLFIAVEEVGILPNLLAVKAQNEATQREGLQKIGVTIYIGTGGDIDKIAEAEQVFRNPDSHNILSFENEYEESGAPIGWFIPYHYCINQVKDENGNTDLARAEHEIAKERKKRIEKNNDSLSGYIMSYPITPAEIFLSKFNQFFPVAELTNVKQKLIENNNYVKKEHPVRLFFDKDSKYGVNYQILDRTEVHVLNYYKYKNKYESKEGCPVIYEFPIDIYGEVPNDMYIFSMDHYGSDNAGESCGAFYVFKTGKYALQGYGYEQIVAEYVARPGAGRDAFNENCEKLMMLYNAGPRSLYYENTKGSIFEYLTKREKLHYLALKPYLLINSANKKVRINLSDYGYDVSSKQAKIEIANLVSDWLVKVRFNDGDTKIRNMDLIPSRALIEEMIMFNLDENFDRVMAFGGAILGLRQRENHLSEELQMKNNAENPLAFFTQRYNNNKKWQKTARI